MFVYIEKHSPLVGRYSLPPADTTPILHVLPSLPQVLPSSSRYSFPTAGTPSLRQVLPPSRRYSFPLAGTPFL